MKNLFYLSGMMAMSMLFTTTSCNNKAAESTTETEEQAAMVATPETAPAPDTTTSAASEDKFFTIKTTVGTIKVKVYKECPRHQENFVKLVNEKFYDGVLFHRVIKEFMIQTGDPESKVAAPGAQYGVGGPGYTIPAEINPAFYHKKGALAAARQGNETNPYKASSGSQFYICQGRVMNKEQLMQFGRNFSEAAIKDYGTIGGTPELDGEYTVFGEVTEGLDIVDKIANTPTVAGDRPKKDIKIISITQDQAPEAVKADSK